ncbi:MAG: FkbM family methyltransferase, partial [Terriglobia bacterium]
RGYFRYFPLRTGKVTAWRLLASHLWWLESPTNAVTKFGSTLQVDARDICGRFIYYFGIWEPNLTAWIRSRLKPGDCFVDVGANVGYFSLLASTLVGDRGKVVSVEAVPRTFEMLTANLEANGASNTRAVNVAAWDKEETLSFFVSPDTIGGTSTAMAAQAQRWKLESRCSVRGAPLGSILTADEIAAARLIKIDVEGAESHVIAGLELIHATGRGDLEFMVEISMSAFEEITDSFRKRGLFPYRIQNDYRAAAYIGESSSHHRRPYRLEAAPQDVTEVDVIFSRVDAAWLV